MDTKLFHYYTVLYETGNIHQAAEKLFISQQGLSQALRSLENEWGVVLFERSRSGLRPTAAGDYFYEKAKAMDAELSKVRQGVLAASSGRVILSLAASYGVMHTMYPWIYAFEKRHPDISVHWRELTDVEVDRALSDGAADVGIVIEDGEEHEKRFMKHLFSRQIMLLVYEGHPFMEKDNVSISDLRGQPIVMEGEQFHIFSLFRKRCLEQGFYPDIVAETTEINLCHKLCRDKVGLGITVDFVADMLQSDGLNVIPILDQGFEWRASMATSESRRNEPAIALFMKEMAEEARKL